MVVKANLDALRSEIATVERMLSRKSSKSPLGRKSLERRLENLRALLDDGVSSPDQHASVALIFDGDPVVGAKSINMGFASQALKQYQDLIQSVISQGSDEQAAPPRRGRTKSSPPPGELFISGVMHGSFGFVLEEDSSQLELLNTRTKEAVVSADNFLQTTSSPEADFDQLLSEVDTKVFQRLRAFIRTLHDADAVLRISERDRTISLDAKNLSVAHERVMRSDILERETVMRGWLIGFSPVKRTFDFRDAETDTLVTGKVSPFMALQTLQTLQELTEHDEAQAMSLGRRYVANIHIKDVERADGTPLPTRYTLLSLTPE
ncbi:MAG: hypothetical protein HWE39_03945 [Oceanospirillaceae bacterium]|uniref:hypothetical protein n=1 Tax=Salipiger sp. HF18 TaxID=2721557 RepID=UPI00142E0360|nr:hypothetical protein [Salipiger sp. HF18]NIY97923.1 hypothetical protein [Salipiger sp. HF18]NVK40372.1 hypothetical protein [Oceanospirillaceae bacterium]